MATVKGPPFRPNTISNLRSSFHKAFDSVFVFWPQILKKPSFLHLHWAYFLSTCFLSSVFFWLFSTINISYVNSLYMVVGAMTQAGLNTVNMSDLNVFQQCLTVVLSMIGNQIVVSIIVIHVRKRAFQTRLKSKRKEEDRRNTSSLKNSITSSIIASLDDHSESRMRNGFVSGVQNIITLIIRNHQRDNIHVDRNSQFYGLSLEERECVRCVEYRAVKFLGYMVLAYYIIWQFFGCLTLGAYISHYYAGLAVENGFNPWWLGISMGIGAFNNSGISLLDSSVTPFQNSTFILLNMSILMLAGNTAFIPDTEKYQKWRETLQFILKFPRRVYTNLFPPEQTWCLLASLIFFNAFDWAAFEILNRYSPTVNKIPAKSILIDGLFQTISMRSSGFVVVPISSLFIGLQSLYVLMMYISVYPITITMRTSNVYEERSLGIYARGLPNSINLEKTGDFSNIPIRRRDRFYFVQEQLRRQLGHDLWFLVIGVLVIISTESSNYSRDPQKFSIFNIFFEIISAYGCVGFSVGLPDQAYSFSGAWHRISRLILCAIMLRGRHRGLPFDIDKAIQLPGEKTDFAEEQDHRIRATSHLTD